MFFFFHLLTGIILGFLLGDILRDRRWILPCVVGSVLPDLIDKPLGHLIFPLTIGDGRIYTHTLFIAVVILITGILFWKRMQDPEVFALGVGLLSHQVLDMMWLEPSNWYHPFLGPFKGGLPEDYIWILLMQEIQNPFELTIAILIGVLLLAMVFYRRILVVMNRNRRVFSRILILSALLLCALSGICIGWGFINHTIPEIGWSRPEELIIGGTVIALAAGLLWRWRIRRGKG
ncbi:metal-dependent hydrolase [uncultured Methanoregula sp.]|uniref:metal-dependent hydrolase n=1 Tax=uncultured Methanoregula sp. TaxID=1005933 RepID=UPI002AAB0E8B|nr:metal-dependent hydrolase [uncultured Methanoregula sp.]